MDVVNGAVSRLYRHPDDLGRHVIVKKPRMYSDYMSKRCKDQKWMESISVEEVLEAVERSVARR